MYDKNLRSDLRLRLSDDDMDYLRFLSNRWGMTISACLRQIIGDMRRRDISYQQAPALNDQNHD